MPLAGLKLSPGVTLIFSENIRVEERKLGLNENLG